MNEDQRRAFLESLGEGVPVPRALRGALGLPRQQGGRAWLAAWKMLGEMRREDDEVREACEGAERRGNDVPRDRSAEGASVDAAARAMVGSGSAWPSGAPDGADVGHGAPPDGSRDGGREREDEPQGEAPDDGAAGLAGPARGAASAAAGVAERREDDDGAEQSASESPRGHASGAGVHDSGKSETDGHGGHDRRLGPGGSGREAPPEAAAGGGEARGDRVDASPTDLPERLTGWGALMAAALPEARVEPSDFDHVLSLDAKCVTFGMPPMSPWWRWSVGSFFASGKSWGNWLVGRGGGKSTTWERVAAAIARYGRRKVPPGQTWTMPFISVGPDDANRRINGIAAVFRADGLAIVGDVDGDGEKVKPGEGVKITRAPRGSLDFLDAAGNSIQLGSIAGTIGNVSGPSTIGLLIDEAAKLHDRTTNANPLTEIVASAAQTSRGRAGWRGIMCSSAFDRAGLHFQIIQEFMDGKVNESVFVATIGDAFIGDALDGFESVAAWEQARGDHAASRRIREHAAGLKPGSPLIPTWVANPTLGSPDGTSWTGAALASRKLVEVLPEEALDGVPRVLFWLRENGSVPLDRSEGRGALTAADWRWLVERNRELNEPVGRTNAQRADDYMSGRDDDADPRAYRGL